MRTAIMGQAAFGARTLETLSERGEQIIGVWLPQKKGTGAPDPLKIAAEKLAIPTYQPESYKSPETLQIFRDTQPELLIMAFVTDIIPPAFIETPSHGSICYHPSLLPRHRGGSAINWAIIAGETETGLSIFWADAGIDTGDIILQKRVPVGPDETTGGVYFDKLFPLGIAAIVESVELIKAGKAPRLVQDEKLATHEPLCNDAVASLDWNQPAWKLHNLIRGCDPQPGAYSFFRGEKIRFFDSRMAAVPEGRQPFPGEVLACDATAFTVAAGSGALRIGKVKSGKGKQSAGEFAGSAGLKPGDAFSLQ